jgi:hypothetical protein
VQPHHQLRASTGIVVLWVLVGGLIALYVLVFGLSAAGRLVQSIAEYSYGESWLLDDARRLVRGEPLYAPPSQVPVTHTAYTPLYYLAVGGLNALVGDHGYAVGRALSLVATVSAAALLAWSVRCLSGRWAFGWLAAGLFLTQNLTVLLWGPLHRVDALALGFTLAGLACCVAGRWTIGALVFALAVLTKQTFIVAPAVALLALWPCRREMARFAVAFGLPVLVTVALAQWLTSGWFLWHTVIGNSNHADFFTFAALMGAFFQFNGMTVLAAAGSLLLPAVPRERLLRLYFLGCLITVPTVVKIGASSNYWLELSAAVAVLLALASWKLSERADPIARVVAPVVLAGTLLFAMPAYQATARQAADAVKEVLWPESPAYLSLISDVGYAPLRVPTSFVRRIAEQPGDVLSDNSGLVAAAGKPILFEFQIFQLLRAEGRWSDEPIVAAVEARRFSLVALMHPLDAPIGATRWTPAVRAALQAAYAPAGRESEFWLYRPR